MTWFIGEIAGYVARSTKLTSTDGTTAPRTVEGFDREVVRPYSVLADSLFGEFGIKTVHAAPYAAMTCTSLRAVAIANWARPDDAMMVTSKEEMLHDLSECRIFNNYQDTLCWYFWVLFLLLTVIFGVDPQQARVFAYDLFPFHDLSAEEFKELYKDKPTGTVKGARQQVAAAREILRHEFTMMVLRSDKVDDVFLVGADVEHEFYDAGGVLGRLEGSICVGFDNDAMRLSHPTIGRFAGAFSSATKKAFLYTPGTGLKLITPMLSMTNLGYGFGQSGPFQWAQGYAAAFEVAEFVLHTKMQDAPRIFNDVLWNGLLQRMKDTAMDFKNDKEKAVREGGEWKSPHQQRAVKAADTMRARPPPADARPLKDGKMPENALSAAMAKRAATLRAKPPPPGAPLLKNGKAPDNALSAARTKGVATLRAKGLVRGRGPKPASHRDAPWFFMNRDPNTGFEWRHGPLKLSDIRGLLAEKKLSVDETLVKPFMAHHTQPWVTIRKMVECRWEYPGPAEGG